MKPNKLLLPSLLFFAQAGVAFAGLTVSDLRCESRQNPLGIDAAQPRLSWILNSPERGQRQTAFQILVASTETKLKSGEGDLWDSRKVESDKSVLVSYAGKALASHSECFWKVRAWDKDGKVSLWSKPAKWTIGLLHAEDWKAKWIGLDGEDKTNWLAGTSWVWFPEGEPEKVAPTETNYFRRVVTIPADRKIKRALFQYTGDNECRGWLNEFDLGARNNFRTVKWNDITTRIEPGNTYVFGLTGRNERTNHPAGVVGLLTIEFETGEPLVIQTDDKWKVSKEIEKGWNTLAFDDSKWVAPKILGPAGMQPWGETRTAEERRLPARWLRKEFAVEKKIERATVYFSGLGLSELYLNGEKVGDAVLSPALSQYDKRVFYVTYDVTKQVRRGANAIGAVLGGGRYFADRSKVYAGTVTFGWPKLLLHLRIEHADGSIGEFVSDESWKLTIDGPILANSEFDGEEYDARRELGDWSKPGYSTSAEFDWRIPKAKTGQTEAMKLAALPRWQPVQLVSAPSGALAAQMIEPIRVTQKLKPVAVTEPKPGVFIFDMGQNIVGWCRLKVRGSAGTQVSLRHAETVNPDGTLYMANLRGARVTDTYTLKGKGPEIYEPRFTYHGFRYVEVTGFPGKPDLNSIEGCVVHDDLTIAGNFSCSNELLNRIYRNIVWGTRGNYRSIPTDCPQRDERQGWLGDRSEESRGESFLFDISALYPKWLQDIADAQKPSGSIPDVAPAYWPIYSDNVTWPSSAIIIPGMLQLQYADDATIARQYDSSKNWIGHMLGFVTNGIISRDSYGDWCVPPEDPALIHSKDPARKTDVSLLATAYFYHDLRLMERYAKMLGKTDDVQRFGKLAEEMKITFNKKFLNRELGQYDNGTQSSCVLPLAFGLVPDDMREKIFNHLVKKITDETKNHIGTGLIGGQYLMRVLSDNGRADLAYTIAAQKDYPSWGYMVEQGATTIWELWNGNTADPTMNSGNHVMLVGDLVIWLYEYLAGIKSDEAQPGFKHIIMKPHPVGDLKSVKAKCLSPHGLISSEWRKDGEKFDWQIEIPVNTTATVYVPGQAATEISSGKYHFVSDTKTSSTSAQPGLLKAEFIYETAPFPSCHASTIAETKSGLVAAWFGGTHERHPDVGIWVSRFENGKWTAPVEVANGVGFATNRFPTWNPVLFKPKSGPLMLFYKVGPSPATWWGMMTTSDDGGKSWSKPRRLPDGILGPIKNKPVQLANGDILCPSSTEGAGGWRVHFERTSDLGKTWTATPTINDGKEISAIQPSILSHPGGKLQTVGRTQQGKLFETWSADGGKTWSKLALTSLPNPNSGTDAVTLKDGRQLLVYNHNIRTGSNNKGRSPLNVAVSEDGKNWFAASVLEDAPNAPNGFSYPAVIQTSDGLVHITYTWKRERIKHVVIDPKVVKLRPILGGAWPK